MVELQSDHVFFIGGREDGRRVAQAAARTLNPVTLVLGGGNPCCVSRFYGPTPQDSPSDGCMTGPQSFSQTRDLLWRSGKVMEAERYIVHATLFPVAIVAAVCLPAAPTILTDAVEAHAVTQQGASGPVLPVLSVAGVDEAVAFVGRREKPLCVYV
ncbi:aldehyde dehydrogenase family 3 member B2 [Gadus macrocephalus]|uniref:aldehyde dehydrogenase family 3 member B2 n=1 Tax=Gadus macrocephalus TaxID=80720 RepID=UPI0028CB2B9A|nr:aldehyde dehydrogenase family 3 member B2 [Gadus macrocephalus]